MELVGLEPTTFCMPCQALFQLSYSPVVFDQSYNAWLLRASPPRNELRHVQIAVRVVV